MIKLAFLKGGWDFPGLSRWTDCNHNVVILKFFSDSSNICCLLNVLTIFLFFFLLSCVSFFKIEFQTLYKRIGENQINSIYGQNVFNSSFTRVLM